MEENHSATSRLGDPTYAELDLFLGFVKWGLVGRIESTSKDC